MKEGQICPNGWKTQIVPHGRRAKSVHILYETGKKSTHTSACTCAPKLVCALICAFVCAPKLVCTLVYAFVWVLLCAPKRVRSSQMRTHVCSQTCKSTIFLTKKFQEGVQCYTLINWGEGGGPYSSCWTTQICLNNALLSRIEGGFQ